MAGAALRPGWLKQQRAAVAAFDFLFFFPPKGYGNHITSGVVGNSAQLHQLQDLVEHLLRSYKKSGVERTFGGVEWS